MAQPRAVTLITGASAGIGRELARVFAANGHELVLIARREERLAELAGEIVAKGVRRPLLLALDLTGPDAVSRIDAFLAAHAAEPQFVVNNAGFGLVGAIGELDRVEQLSMIDLNVRVLADLSLAWLDTLERRKGGILNVASVAGFMPGPQMTVYYATKAFVVSFSEALHHELAPRGIRVSALCPGPVPTEFQARAGFAATSYSPLLTYTATRTAELGYRGLMGGKRLVIPGFANKAVTILAALLPRRVVLALHDGYQRRRHPAKTQVPHSGHAPETLEIAGEPDNKLNPPAIADSRRAAE
jgi:short-subunit dehydrogenase